MAVSSFDLSTLVNLLPQILLLVLAGIVMTVDLFLPEERKKELAVISIVGLAVILLLAITIQPETEEVLGGMIRTDLTARIFGALFIIAALVTCLISMSFDDLRQGGEYYALILIATLGMGLMAAANDLIMLYVAMELTSITQYLLVAYLKDDLKSSEAGIKYFIFGAVASTVMLYGLSLFYGFTGETSYGMVAETLANFNQSAVLLALILITVGFGFKVSAVPFHFWTPDVYEGAPTPITAYISVASKAAGFAVLVRVFYFIFPANYDQWRYLVETLSIVTMTVGNLLALTQTNIKRLLAYSSIAQAGYVLIGVAAVTTWGVASVVFYLGIYVLSNLAAFATIVLVANKVGSDEIKDYAALSRRSPYLGLAMLLALLSLGGIPPLAGFVGKLYLFQAAMQEELTRLVIIGVLNAIVALYYYLNVARVIYVERSDQEDEPVPVSAPASWALGITCLGILLVGVVSTPWYNLARQAAEAFF